MLPIWFVSYAIALKSTKLKKLLFKVIADFLERKAMNEFDAPFLHNQGYVYLMQVAGTELYKIGSSSNPFKRLDNIQSSKDIPIEALSNPPKAIKVRLCALSKQESRKAAFAAERLVHESLSEYRIPGGEWFLFSESLARWAILKIEEIATEEIWFAGRLEKMLFEQGINFLGYIKKGRIDPFVFESFHPDVKKNVVELAIASCECAFSSLILGGFYGLRTETTDSD